MMIKLLLLIQKIIQNYCSLLLCLIIVWHYGTSIEDMFLYIKKYKIVMDENAFLYYFIKILKIKK